MPWQDTASGMRFVPDVNAIPSGLFGSPNPEPMRIQGISASPPPVAGGTAGQNDAYASIQGVLTEYGLPSLANTVWRWIVDGRSESEVVQLLRQTPEFKTRFAAIEQRKQAGLPAISPQEVLDYEKQARAILKQNGMPEGFYDSPDDYAKFLVNDVSLRELEERVVGAFTKIQMAPPSVRDKFSQFFGVTGEGGLAAFALDPDRATPLLLKQVSEAENAGIGRDFGFDFGRDVAGRLADRGVTGDQARQGFAQLQAVSPLFNETISEQQDLGALDAGVEAVFNLGGDGAQQLERRRQERAAAGSGRGGAATTRTGISGLGGATRT